MDKQKEFVPQAGAEWRNLLTKNNIIIQGVPKKMCTPVTRICYRALARTILRCRVLLLKRLCTYPFPCDVRTYPDKNMQNRLFRRRGTVVYPPSSPNLTPVDFFV